jgi:hypothetical protein
MLVAAGIDRPTIVFVSWRHDGHRLSVSDVSDPAKVRQPMN